MTVFFPDSYAMSLLAHKAPIFITKVSLDFLRLSKGAHSLHDLLLPGVTAVIPSVFFCKSLVLANPIIWAPGCKEPSHHFACVFHEAKQSPGIFPPHE